MKLSTVYEGSREPFEGDHTIWLRSLPVGARAIKASIRLIPASPAGGTSFQETFVFNSSDRGPNELNPNDWGVTRTSPGAFVEVDFHSRRTLAKITGSGTATLQIDVGGVYAGVAVDGTLNPNIGPLSVTLSTTGTDLPSLTASKFKLTGSSLTVNSVTIRSVATNLTVKLGQTPPFWVRVGELATADTSPDFAEVLNAFLVTTPKENGFYQIPFVLHSDTLARLNVELNIDYVLEQVVLPPHLPEVILPYNFSTLPGADEKLTTVALPRQAIPVAGRSTAQIRGEFQPTRVRKGNIGEEPQIFPVRVAPDCSLAQAFRSDIEIALTGIDVPLANTQTGLAGMNITLQADADGKPFGEVLIRADVRVEKPLPGQSSWGSATLSSPFRILPGRRYWLVLQSLVGEAYWNAIAGTLEIPTLQCSRDGGLSWRAATATGAPSLLSALFRLRDQPDRFSIPVQLQIGKGPSAVRRRLDEYAPLGRIEFSFDFAEKLAEHLDKPELDSPCGTGELLVNSGFDDPPHDDATRRLFGFDVASESGVPSSGDASIEGVLDLSRGVDLGQERFISLSIANSSPVRIDCAGKIPSNTMPNEIEQAINSAMHQSYQVASFDSASGKLSLCSEGFPGKIELHPWQQAAVPQGWQLPPGATGRIGRVKLPTVSPSNSEANAQTSVERVVAVLNASENETAILAQPVPVAGGCTYLLSFIFRMAECIDFRERPAATNGNPLTERGTTFLVLEPSLSGEFGAPALTPAAQTSIDDQGRGIQGLNCKDKTVINLPYECSSVELTLSTGISEVMLVTAQAFDSEDNGLASEPMSDDGQTPQTLKLTGTNIIRVEVTTPTSAEGDTNTLLHAMCFEGPSDILPVLGDTQRQAPSWEVRWLDANNQLIKSNGEEFNASDLFLVTQSQCDIRLVAPQGAMRAEIRFIQSSPGVTFLDSVSFSPTLEMVHNATFGSWETSTTGQAILHPSGWTMNRGWVDRPGNSGRGVLLRGDGPEDAILFQAVSALPGQSYELKVNAVAKSLPGNDRERQPEKRRARLELHWLGEGPIGSPMVLPLDGRDFPLHAWSSVAPAGTKQAEIRLIQPRGQGHLFVKSVSLTQVDQIEVPLIFLAETPGELTLSNLRITYDLPQPPEEEMPGETAPQGPTAIARTTASHRAEMLTRPVEATRGATMEIVAMAAASRESPLAHMPAAIVSGVGERFSKTLKRLRNPVKTIADLATLDPEADIKTIPRERRLELKTAAEMILAIDLNVEPFGALEQESLEELLTMRPEQLADQAGESIVLVEQFQRGLRALRLLVKNDDFRNLHLEDLAPRQD